MLLNTANKVYFGAAQADRVYLGSSLVYHKLSESSTEYTVFGNTVPGILTSHDDAGDGAWLGQQYYSINPSPLKVTGGRIYVPAGSDNLGQSVRMGLNRRALADGGTWKNAAGMVLPNDYSTNGSMVYFPIPLVVGWNSFYFSTSYPMLQGDGIVLAFSIGTGNRYFYNSDLVDPPYINPDGMGFALSERGGSSSTPGRCVYNGLFTEARWYGFDIIVEQA